MEDKILIYGATGYTGKLFAKHLLAQNQKPILAGRSDKVNKIGEKLNCETRIFSTDKAHGFLKDVNVLVNLAGPFTKTQENLIKACINTKTHYLDIAGEVPELETAFKYQEDAQKAEIVVISGAGFGIVPTDIAAKLASELLENPTELMIAYATEGAASRGTLHTVLKDIHKAGVIIKNGKQEIAQPAKNSYKFQVGEKNFKAVYNPWRADLFTAQISTGIKNIETYSVFPRFVVSMMKGKMLWLRNLMLKRLINWLPEGPSQKQLNKGKTFIKAIVKNEQNGERSVEIVGPEAYVFTIKCLDILANKLSKKQDKFGVLTPSFFGKELIENIEGVEIRIK